MVSQPKETPITEVNQGATPADYDAGFLSRVISSINLVFRSLREWVIDDYVTKDVAVETFVYAAYGGMSSSGTSNAVIGSGWDTLGCDTVNPVPLHMVVDLPSSSLAWNFAGINALSIVVVVTHDESNASREFYLRAWNIDKGVQVGVTTPVGIARNQPVSNMTLTLPVEIIAGYEGDRLRIEVGGTSDAITVVSWDAIRVWAWNVGQFKGDIDDNSTIVSAYSATFDVIESLQDQISSLQTQAASHETLTWDDLIFPATAVNPPGQASDPIWDNIIPGWLFSASKTEVLHIVSQLPHNWVEGSELRPHLHWTKTNNGGGDVYWQLEYAWSAIGEVITPFTTLFSTSPVAATPDTDTDNKQLVTSFPGIDGTGRQISDMLLMRLSRVGGNAADTYGADARLLEYDIHYLRYPLSSKFEFSRT